jgi:hypothetical protein
VGPRELCSNLNNLQTFLSLIWPKQCLPKLKTFQIIYRSIGFELRNKFPYWNFFRFAMEFE